jgi:hypothetical protein
MYHYVHSIPGRLRVRTPFMKRNVGIDREVLSLLSPFEGINAVTTNSVTGSIVITYDADVITAEVIIDVFKQAGYFDPAKAVTNDQYIHSAVSKTGGVLWKAVSGAFVENAVSHPALSLVMALI